ncbi:MAG TPA: hypothetical protein VI643_01610 [Planctomycetota bacterium]|nr:hypothetical protein [Planctomycetota bacterium]
MNECLSPDQWGILADPDSPDEGKEGLLSHAVRCPDCVHVLDLFEAIPRALPIKEAGTKKFSRAMQGLAAAALFLLALLAAWLLVPGDRDSVLEGTYWTSHQDAPVLPMSRLLTAGDNGLVVKTPEGARIDFAPNSKFRWDGGLDFTIERGQVEFSGPALRLRVPGGRILASDAHFEVVAMKRASQALFVTVMTGTISFAADSGKSAEMVPGDSLRISSEGEWVLLRQDQDKEGADETVAQLLARLKSDDPDVRSAARQSLRKRGPAVLPSLEKAREENPSLREQLSTVIRQIEEDRENEFSRLIVRVITVRRLVDEASRATGSSDVYRGDYEIRFGDIPDAAKLKELLRLDAKTAERIVKTFAEFEAKRRESESRIDPILARWKNPPGEDPILWKEWIAEDYPVLSKEWTRLSGLPLELIDAIKKQLDERERKAFETELDERLAEKIYRQILPSIRFFYAGDPPNHEGLGAGRLVGMGRGILPGLKRARLDERFPLKDRQRLDPIIQALEK